MKDLLREFALFSLLAAFAVGGIIAQTWML